MTAWLIEVTGPKWVALDEVNAEFFLTDNANDAISYSSEDAAKHAIVLFMEKEELSAVRWKMSATEHEW